jgi:hypothetical protein
MPTLPLNDRLTPDVGTVYTATAGQTDFAADFPIILSAAGVIEGLFVRRVRDTQEAILSYPESLDVIAQTDGGFTVRLGLPCEAGDSVQIYSQLPADRDRANAPGGSIRTDTLEGDALRFAALIQELRRDVDRAVKAPLGQVPVGTDGGVANVPAFFWEGASQGQGLVWDEGLNGFVIDLDDSNIIQADAIADVNISIASPPGNIGGADLNVGDNPFLPVQTDGRENGLYVFNGAGVPLTRAGGMAAGKLVTRGQIVISDAGGDDEGLLLTLQSPAGAIIGVDATTWQFFGGEVTLRSPGSYRKITTITGMAAVQGWDRIQSADLPKMAIGETLAARDGVSVFAVLNRRYRLSQWINVYGAPFANASAISQCLLKHNVMEWDVPRAYLDATISANFLSNKEIIFHGTGRASPAQLVMTGDFAGFNLAGVSGLKMVGPIAVKHLLPPTTNSFLNITGATVDVEIEKVIGIGVFRLVRVVGAPSGVKIGALDGVGVTGGIIYLQGSGGTVSDFTVGRVSGTGSGTTAIAVEVADGVGAYGVDGLHIGEGVVSGFEYGYYQHAATTAPMNIQIDRWRGAGQLANEVLVKQGAGRLTINNLLSDAMAAGGGSGVRVESPFTGFLDMASPTVTRAQQHGFHFLSTAMTFDIKAPVANSNGQATTNTYSGLRMETGVGYGRIVGGALGDRGFTARQKYAVDCSGVPPRMQLENVDVGGCVTGAVNPSDWSGTTTTKKQFNRGDDW